MNKANLLLSLPLVAAATDAAYTAVRHGNFKAIRDEKSTEWELYDVVADRTERHNLAAEHPEMLKELIGKWDEWAATHFVLPKRAPK